MSELVEAIDRAVAFVRAHPDEMTRGQVDELTELADRVYLLAHRGGLRDALPQVPELRPQLQDRTIRRRVQFETKLQLPGDWDRVPSQGRKIDAMTVVQLPGDWDRVPSQDRDVDAMTVVIGHLLLPPEDAPLSPYLLHGPERSVPLLDSVFLVCATDRWYHDMEMLRALAADVPQGPSVIPQPGATPASNNRSAAEHVPTDPPEMPWEDERGWEEPKKQIRQILTMMMGRDVVSWDELTSRVWEKTEVAEGTVKTALSRTNSYLQAHGYPRYLTKVRDESRIIWTDPPPSNSH